MRALVRVLLQVFKVGSWLFAGLLALSCVAITVAPEVVEQRARPFIIRMVGNEALRRYPTLRGAEAFEGLAATINARIADARELESTYPQVLAQVLDGLCCYRCPDAQLDPIIRSSLAAVKAKWEVARAELGQWAQGQYGDLVAKVLVELRVFLATNCVLLFLAGVSLHHPRGTRRIQITLSAILLTTVILAGYFYVFVQNWLYTLIFSDYVGSGYVLWVCGIASVLLDCVFNRGRVTRSLLSSNYR